jgi:hypothetical protein
MVHLDASNTEDAKCICAMTLSDDLSDCGDSTDDGTESNKDYVEPREGDLENAEDAILDDDCCNEVDTTHNCFTGKDKTKWGTVKSTTHI